MKWELNRWNQMVGRRSSGEFHSGAQGSVCTTFEVTEAGVTVTAVEAGNPVRTGERFQAAWPQGLDWQKQPDAAGQWLETELQAAGFVPENCILIVSRRDVTMKTLTLPQVDPDELVALVRLQAESRIGQAVDSRVIDFQPVPVHAADDQNVVLLTMGKAKLQTLQRVVAACGFQGVAAVSPELLLPSLIDCDNGQCILDVLLEEDQCELLLSRDGVCLTSVSTRIPGEPKAAARQILASGQRLLAAVRETAGKNGIQFIRVFAGSHGNRLSEELSAAAGVPAISSMPEGIRDSAELRAVTAVSCRKNPQVHHDFLHPRRAADRALVRRRKIVQFGVTAAMIVCCCAWWLFEENQEATRRIAALRNEQQLLSELIEQGQTVIDKRTMLARWQAGNIHWTQELIRFSGYLPSTERAYLTRMELQLEPGSETPVIRSSGVAREAKDVMELNEQLLQAGSGYELLPHEIEQNPQDQYYRVHFEIETKLRDAHAIGSSVQGNHSSDAFESSEHAGH